MYELHHRATHNVAPAYPSASDPREQENDQDRSSKDLYNLISEGHVFYRLLVNEPRFSDGGDYSRV